MSSRQDGVDRSKPAGPAGAGRRPRGFPWVAAPVALGAGGVVGVLLGLWLLGEAPEEAAAAGGSRAPLAGPGAAAGGGGPPPGDPAPSGYTLRDLYDFVASCGAVLPDPGSHGLVPPGAPGTGDMPAIEEVMAILEGRLCTGGGTLGPLPDTGQRTCYDEGGNVIDCASATCPGQDGLYRTGCPPEGRFLDNLDGTVTDRCTGLMWQKGTADINGDGVISVWPDTRDMPTWCEALEYCEALELAGYTDWRLPNVRELQSIADYGRYLPSIDPVFEAVSSWYWSSSSVARLPDFAWNVSFSRGNVYNAYKDNHYLVRAVRAGP